MSYKFIFFMIMYTSSVFSKNLFMGIVEDNSVNKNSFLCPLSLNASGNVVCQNMDTSMVGFDVAGGHTIQMFNNQQYWLQQKSERQHLLMVRGYQEDRLSNTMTQEGWDHMGAFSVILTTDPMVLKAIKPEMIPAKGQVKLIAQLWYSAATGLQLWGQDVILLSPGQNFRILLSHSSSDLFDNSVGVVDQVIPTGSTSATPAAPGLSRGLVSNAATKNMSTTATPTTLANFKQQFLEKIGFAPKNIDKNVYSAAHGSPRSIAIQVQ